MALQTLDTDQQYLIDKGKIFQQTLRNQINEALTNNPFNTNYVISSLPGLGKSFETQQALKSMANPPLIFEGSASIYAFTIDIATAVYLSKGQPLVVVLDDCDILFEDKNINIAKKMFDDSRCLKYSKNYRTLKSFCTDLQFEALSSFGSDDKAGVTIPLNTVTFIILTNRHFPTVNEVERVEAGTARQQKLTDLYAIRRRTEYKEIEMSNDELWGYVANVVLNEQICEKFKPDINNDYKNQILTWCYSNWSQVTERNLSLVEKMTKDIVRYPSSYLDIWKHNYL